MPNYCVSCNSTEELPEGTLICSKCQKSCIGYCPECGSPLRDMFNNTLFHCDTCHRDWQYDEGHSRLIRKFWG